MSVSGPEMFHCMTCSQCDFSQGQDEVMPVLVSFRKLTASVCQRVTLSNRICEPVPFINSMSVSLSLSSLFLFDSTNASLQYAIL